MDKDILLWALIISGTLFLVFFCFTVYKVARARKQARRELSGEAGVYTGPAGEPKWNGKLPDRVDDYTEPRYVYENLVESTDFLPENGRIIGYRISPTLVIHSRVNDGVNSPSLFSYIERLGGKLLNAQDVAVLHQNWSKIEALKEKAGDIPLGKAKWLWGTYNNFPVVFSVDGTSYRNEIGFNGVWHPLILKR